MNYPESTGPNDPDAPWNQLDTPEVECPFKPGVVCDQDQELICPLYPKREECEYLTWAEYELALWVCKQELEEAEK